MSNMWQMSQAIAERVEIPLRCRAISKCVWREWREYLMSREGKEMSADELFAALLRRFEQAVVEYGWQQEWRELPEPFISIMRRTAKAAIESRERDIC